MSKTDKETLMELFTDNTKLDSYLKKSGMFLIALDAAQMDTLRNAKHYTATLNIDEDKIIAETTDSIKTIKFLRIIVAAIDNGEIILAETPHKAVVIEPQAAAKITHDSPFDMSEFDDTDETDDF